MANQPKKLTDPTDEAMTAIQQVLSATDEPMDTRGSTVRPQTPREPAPHSSYASEPSPEKDLFEGPAHLTSDDARPGQFAANDDRLSIGQILHSLQQRPSNELLCHCHRVRARLGGLRRRAGIPLSAGSAGGAEARSRPASRP